MIKRANISEIKVNECLKCLRTDKDYGIIAENSYLVVRVDDDFVYIINDKGLIVGFKRRTGYFVEPELDPEVIF
jgi:serine phosphatase RsbU (regulator of sigma subunit)